MCGCMNGLSCEAPGHDVTCLCLQLRTLLHRQARVLGDELARLVRGQEGLHAVLFMLYICVCVDMYVCVCTCDRMMAPL